MSNIYVAAIIFFNNSLLGALRGRHTWILTIIAIMIGRLNFGWRPHCYAAALTNDAKTTSRVGEGRAYVSVIS